MVRPSIVIGHGTVRQDSISHWHSWSDLAAQPPWPEAECTTMCAPLARGPALVQSKLLQSTIAFSLTAALNQSSGRLAGADGGSKDPASSGTRSGPRAQARPCGPVTT